MRRCKNLKDLNKLGLTLDPRNPSKAIPVSRSTPPGTSPIALPAICPQADGIGLPSAAPNWPTTGQPDDTPERLIATAKALWAKIRRGEKYLTASKWELAGKLEAIQEACGDNLKAWTAAYKKIGIDRRRVSEILLYRQVFTSREEAAKCSVPRANTLIRRAARQGGKPEAYNPWEDCFATPQWLYDVLNAEFSFGLDAAATNECHKCNVYLTPEQDALKQDWKAASGGRPVFLNAPFHRSILPAFVAKAFNESQGGLEVVCILPYYKSYPWFRDFVWAYAEVRQIQGHVVFDGFGPKAKKHAGNIAGPQSFDSIVAIFRPGQKGFSGPYIDRPGSRSASPSEPGLLEGLQEVLDSAKQNQTSKETLVGRGETEECDEQAASKAEQSRESLREQYGPEYYDYATPDWLRKAIERDYGFPALDVAASHGKQFGKVWYTPEQDGLRQEWYRDAKGGLIWANPPYGSKTLGEWVKKGYQASQQGATVLMLLPLWRKYDWFSAYVVKYAEVRFATVPVVSVGFGPMTGRKCGNTNWYSEYESILAIFRKGQEGFLGEWIRP